MSGPAAPDAAAVRPLLRNSGSALLLTGAQTGARFAGALLIAHHLGARDFGLFALVWAHVELFRVVADLGLEPVLVRRVALDPAGWPPLWRRAVRLKLGTAAVAAALAVALGGLWGYGARFDRLLLLALPSLFLTSLTNVLAVPHVAGLTLHRIAWVGAASGAIYLAAVAAAGALGLGLPAFVLCAVGCDALSAAGVLAIARPGRAAPGAARPPGVGELLREAWAPALTALLVTAYVRLGLLLVGAWTDLRTAGHLALATRLAESVKVVSGAVATSTFPHFARLLQAGRRAETARLFCGLGAALAGGVLAAALLVQYRLGPLLAALFPRYERLDAFLVPLLWAMVFAVASMHASSLLSAAGRFRVITGAAAANTAVSLAANAALIPSWGGVGAAWAYLATEAVNAGVQLAAVAAVLRAPPTADRAGDVGSRA